MNALPDAGLLQKAHMPGQIVSYGASGGSEARGILTDMKSLDLSDETLDDFSDAPLSFEAAALDLWKNTQRIYYHACIANRFSDEYLKYCGELEKSIRNAGSFCLAKAVLEKEGMELPLLGSMDILSLVRMVSYHFRKCGAAFEGAYRDNNFLGLSYLDWQLRWASLSERLKATEVRIQKIRDGKVRTEDLLAPAKVFEAESAGNEPGSLDSTQSLPVNNGPLPVRGTPAGEFLRTELEKRKQQEKQGEERRPAGKSIDSDPGPSGSCSLRSSEKDDAAAPFTDPENSGGPRSVEDLPELEDGYTEAEVRRILISKAMKEGDQDALREIPLEDTWQLYLRWMRHLNGSEMHTAPPERNSPSGKVKKKPREKGKKKRQR